MEVLSGSSSSSDIAHEKKDSRVATIEQQPARVPKILLLCVVGKGWFCKTCVSLSGISLPGVPYITKITKKTNNSCL